MKNNNENIKERLKKLISKKIALRLSIFLLVGIIGGTTFRVLNDNRKYRIKRELETRGYEVFLGEKSIGKVRKKETAVKLLKDIKSFLSNYEEFNSELLEKGLKYQDIHAEDSQIATTSLMRDEILDLISFNIQSYCILINGKNVGALKTKEEAQKILDSIKTPYIDRAKQDDNEIKEINFLEKVEIVKKEQPITNIKEHDELLRYITKGTTEEKTHIVEQGDSFWSVSKKYNVSINDLEKANPDYVNGYLKIGAKLSLQIPKSFVTVVTKEETKITEKIGFETKYEKTPTLYEDESRIKRKGTYGEREVVALIEKQNGVEKSRDVLSENITAKPMAQIEIKGTKKVPPLNGTGIFSAPTNGRLSSRYGPRWGRFHRGIDLASRIGTSIKAADAGTVVFAGYRGSYGYMIEISHGAGYSTRYAHCSKLYVKRGEKVYKGKTIAAVGNTGNSDGPHVHFEVIKYGKTKNPLTILNKKYK
ncbi:peptidoglycan DD-metalloendopeptidase family protein [Clostridiaceae bacterium M8S5]|nr:peptidoglycan DD-metalloendopeptidase family protein [Clostridiaceae bacterium M8S5]